MPDAGALEAARDTCRAARPDDLFDARLPDAPPDRAPHYSTVALVLVDVRTLAGDVADAPPPEIEGRAYYSDPGFDEPGFADIERPAGPDAELLACLDQRVTDEATYSGPSGSLRAAVADVLVYPVEAVTGRGAGRPWRVAAASFPSTLLGGEGVDTGLGFVLLPAGGRDITAGLLGFLDLLRPMAGVFQGGTHHGFINPEPDAALLREGTTMSDGESFVVRLVVFDDRDSIAFIEVFCAPDDPYYGNAITGPPIRIARDVPIRSGRFSIRSRDVRLAGQFVGVRTATGSIVARSPRARACAIPDEATWTANTASDIIAERQGDDYVVEIVGPAP